jgi:ketopantoate hydroxymethyltransferase
VAIKALSDYANEVRSGSFPDDDHAYKMNQAEASKLEEALKTN